MHKTPLLDVARGSIPRVVRGSILHVARHDASRSMLANARGEPRWLQTSSDWDQLSRTPSSRRQVNSSFAYLQTDADFASFIVGEVNAGLF